MTQQRLALAATQPVAARSTRYVELVRVSTSDQADRDTPEMQRTALDRLRQSSPGEFVKRIEALAISGAAPLAKRVDLQEVFDLLAGGFIDEVRVYSFDRLTRTEDGVERAMIFKSIAEAGARIRTCDGRVIDPAAGGEAGAFAEFGFQFEGWLAAQERRRFRRRTTDGRRRGILDGHLVSGSTAYGYRYFVKTKSWVVEPAEAAVVKQMFQWSASGESLRSIAARLNVAGVKPKRTKKWEGAYIERMLKNPTYKGEAIQRVGDEVYTTAVPAIVDADLWEQVQRGLAQRKKRPQRPKTIVEALIRGRAFCACGSPMNVINNATLGRAYYYCAARIRKSDAPACAAPGHPLSLVDGAVWGILAAHLRTPDLVREAAGLTAKPDTANWEAQLDAAQRKQAALVSEINEVLDLRREGLLAMDDVRERLAGLSRQRDIVTESAAAARRAIEQRETARAALVSLDEQLAALGGALDSADFATRRSLIEKVLPVGDDFGVVIHPDGHMTIRGALDLSVPSGNDDDGVLHPSRSGVAFPEKPPAEWFVVDLFEHAEQAASSPVDVATALMRALALGRFDREVLREMAESFGSRATRALVDGAMRETST